MLCVYLAVSFSVRTRLSRCICKNPMCVTRSCSDSRIQDATDSEFEIKEANVCFPMDH